MDLTPIEIDESSLTNSLGLIDKRFKCEKSDNFIKLSSEGIEIESTYYDELGEITMTINEGSVAQDIVVSSEPNKQKVIVIRFIYNETWEFGKRLVGKGISDGIVLYNSNTKHRHVIRADVHHKWITLRMSVDFYLKLSKGINIELTKLVTSDSPWVLYEAITPDILQCLNDLYAIKGKREPGNNILILSLGFRLMGLLAKRILLRSDGVGNFGLLKEDYDTMLSVRDDILSDITQNPNTKELASKYALSESKLRNDFKKMYGMPIFKYLMQERFSEAYRRIQSGDETIKTIVYDTGFTNISHFSKGFKELFGLTPLALRKSKK